jgi:drug/metabolite transporter (DMT)-like permease
MDNRSRSLIEIHFAVLLFGLAGLFGKFLQIPPIIISFGRVFFALPVLLIIILLRRQKIRLTIYKDYLFLIMSGVILSVHWITFFKSIQISTIAIGLITYSTFPVFTAFIEPIFFKYNFKIQSLIPVLISFIGILLVIPKYELSNNLTQGAFWGIISGITFAFLQTINRKFVQKYSSIVITFYQVGIATIILCPFIFLYNFRLSENDFILIIILGVVFTAIAHSLFIEGLRNIKAYNAGIIALLEPVYGIIFAFILLNEIPSFRVISGGVIIFTTASYITLSSKKGNS